VSDVQILPASAGLWPAITDLFSAGGDPKWCWCMFWRKPGSNWSNTTAEENRAGLEALVGGDLAPGLVALRDGTAVGWVGLGPREAFGRLERSRTIPRLDGDGVWSVNCFVVAKGARRTGIANALLEAAAAYARDHGARTLEGYPVDTQGGRITSASAYTGTLGMFLRAGFTIAADTTSRPAPGVFRKVVQRAL
jgi:GNAT superfamily N-acetyltransferase